MTSVYIPARAVLGIESEAVQAKDGRPGRRVGIELDMADAHMIEALVCIRQNTDAATWADWLKKVASEVVP